MTIKKQYPHLRTKKNVSLIKDDVISEYYQKIHQRLGTRLKKIYLFGSHARGDARVSSDYDYALIVDVRDRELEEAILDVSTFILDEFNVLISTQIFTEQEWTAENKSPLGKNILMEGIAL